MSGPVRLWVLSNEYEPQIIGGLGTAVTNLAKAYARIGTEVTVISQNKFNRVDLTNKKQLSIIRFPLKSGYYNATQRQFKASKIMNWLLERRFELPQGIHIHSIQFKDLARYLQAKYRLPVIYTCHSLIQLEPGPTKGKKLRALQNQIQLLKLANKVIVPSHSERKKLVKLYPFCKNKVAVIHHGITSTLYVKPFTTSRSPYRLLFVGRLVPSKGIEPLLKSIHILKREQPNVRLDLVGKGSVSYTRQLQRQIKKLGIAKQVRLLGFREQQQVQKMYPTYGAVIMPSQQESFGLVALEALASGVPLVSTRAGGLADFVSSNVAQTITQVKATSIAYAIRKMWSNRSLTDRRVQAGLKLAVHFHWPEAAKKYKKQFKLLK